MSRRPATAMAAALIVLLAAASAPAADATLTTVDGAVHRGEITGLTTATITLTTPAGRQEIPTRDLVTMSLGAAAEAEPAHRAILRSGDVICGTVTGGSGETVQVQSPSLGEVSVPIGDIAALHLQPGDDEVPPPTQTQKDELLLANGDTLPGLVVSFGKESLTFDCALGKLPVPLERIRTVSFAAIGTAYREPQDLLLVVTCADGSTITAPRAELADATLALQTTLGAQLRFPLRNVVGIRCRNGRLIYLSDLDPVEVKEVPLFDEHPWGYRRDRSVGGNEITLRGKTYRKGIGVHSRCELTWNLAGGFKEFSTLIGIDDEVLPGAENCGLMCGGNVEARIYLDGKPAFTAREVKKGKDPVPVKLDVTGVQRLKLVVDFGEELHINDHADWADAKLLR